MINAIQNKYYGFWAFIAVSLFSNSVFAQGSSGSASTTGLDSTADNFVDTLISMTDKIGVGVATLAVFIFGYQVSFGGKSPQAAAPVLIGGVIIGAAGVIAKAMVGDTTAAG